MQPTFRSSQKPYAIVIGLDNVRGVYAARTLARHQVPLIAIAMSPASYGCRTNVCKEVYFANTGNEEFIETLEMLGPKLSQKAVLFPCSDTTVLTLSRHRRRLTEWYHVVLPEPDVVEMLLDKIRFYTYAEREGFPIPRTFFLHSRADVEEAAKQLVFPCVLKPPLSKSPQWTQHTKIKAFKISNVQELFDAYDYHREWADALIVQEWIEGGDADLYACHGYFTAASEPIVTFTSRKLRQWPTGIGEACLAEECQNDLVLRETVRLFRSVHLRGLGYVEMKCDARSGQYFIVEPNIGRPSARMAIVEAGGVELLYTMYCDTVGLPLPTNLEQRYEGIKWIHLRRDFQSALHYWLRGKLTLREWWRSLRGRKSHALWSGSDPGPFLGDLKQAIRVFLLPKEHRKRGHRH